MSAMKFGWKRKAGEMVNSQASDAFEREAKDEEDNEVSRGEVDWITLVPKKKKKVMLRGDSTARFERLKTEGTALAEAERYWEAIKKWDAALQYMPNDETLYEMIAQAYMAVHEVFLALRSATKAVELKPNWHVAHQTLGRAHLNIGEVTSALRSFSRAIHLNPADQELWQEDLAWTADLLQRKKDLQRGVKQAEINASIPTATVTEITEETNVGSVFHAAGSSNSANGSGKVPDGDGPTEIKRIPPNYVVMRDNL